jgi:hypothetical protein
MRLFAPCLLFLLIVCHPSQALAPCNTSLEILPSQQFYVEEKIQFSFKLDPKPDIYIIEYWVEDTQGSVIKPIRQTHNTNTKSFSPKLTAGSQILAIRARLVNGSCTASIDTVVTAYVGIIVPSNNTQEFLQKTCCPCTEPLFRYFIEHVSATITQGDSFTVKVRLENHDVMNHSIQLASYMYRGSKVYSHNRTHNMMSIILGPGEMSIIELPEFAHADPGTYNLKIRLRQDDQKTEKELTTQINVTAKEPLIPYRPFIDSLSLSNTDPTEVSVCVNSSLSADLPLGLELMTPEQTLKSEFDLFQERQCTLFSPSLSGGNNPLFAKLYLNQSLIDISELIVSVPENTHKAQPFVLTTGDARTLNISRSIMSSDARAYTLAPYGLILTLCIVCVALISRNKSP